MINLVAGRDAAHGIFYWNSQKNFSDIRDGISETIAIGETSTDIFDSTWLAVVDQTEYAGWRVVSWTAEPPNNPPTSEIHFHGFAQFHSYHPGVVNFAFADGSVRIISDSNEPEIFLAMGTIKGHEKIGDY